jgi:hypothetical protein
LARARKKKLPAARPISAGLSFVPLQISLALPPLFVSG